MVCTSRRCRELSLLHARSLLRPPPSGEALAGSATTRLCMGGWLVVWLLSFKIWREWDHLRFLGAARRGRHPQRVLPIPSCRCVPPTRAACNPAELCPSAPLSAAILHPPHHHGRGHQRHGRDAPRRGAGFQAAHVHHHRRGGQRRLCCHGVPGRGQPGAALPHGRGGRARHRPVRAIPGFPQCESVPLPCAVPTAVCCWQEAVGALCR